MEKPEVVTTKNCPCYYKFGDCPERTMTCHATCGRYKNWLEKYRQYRNYVNKIKGGEKL